MKLFACLLAGMSMIAIGGCDRREIPENQPTPQPAAGTVDTGTPPSADDGSTPPSDTTTVANATADDALALGLLGAVNEHEIAAAKQAKDKKVSMPVLQFAEMMDTQHSENQAKTRALGALASTPEVQALADKGKRELEVLADKSGKDYETAYVDAMVSGHVEALTLIDTRLLSLASSAPVKQHLTETRDHVAMHLEAAKKLQSPAQ